MSLGLFVYLKYFNEQPGKQMRKLNIILYLISNFVTSFMFTSHKFKNEVSNILVEYMERIDS